MQILLIEDNPDHAFLIQDMLQDQFSDDHELFTATTLQDGLEQLGSRDFDICLCDLSLPDSTFNETSRRLRHYNTRTPIVVLTALDDMAIEKKLLQIGIQDYLPKDDLSPRLLHRSCLHAVERKKLHRKIEELSVTDPLTGLYNRREFDRLLALQAATAKRHNSPKTLCMIDLDNFKSLNDEFGHQAGDMVLREVGDTLAACIRETDVACRLGGDEFVILLSHSDPELSLVCARRIQEHLKEKALEFDGKPLPITLSIGIAQYDTRLEPEENFDRADTALYQSKAAGRNTITLYEESPTLTIGAEGT
ncbi:MAG: diguanylate cyclase [Gammaproteobacteria bacterium]|nr:diguanylate cyclase [Gammaproteobacteria bacterium]